MMKLGAVAKNDGSHFSAHEQKKKTDTPNGGTNKTINLIIFNLPT